MVTNAVQHTCEHCESRYALRHYAVTGVIARSIASAVAFLSTVMIVYERFAQVVATFRSLCSMVQ